MINLEETEEQKPGFKGIWKRIADSLHPRDKDTPSTMAKNAIVILVMLALAFWVFSETFKSAVACERIQGVAGMVKSCYDGGGEIICGRLGAFKNQSQLLNFSNSSSWLNATG